jgi:hypothetical protein
MEKSSIPVFTREEVVRVQNRVMAQTVEIEAEDEKYYRPDTQAIYFNEPPEETEETA